ncbi:MAG: aerobic carbon-monoxide dehydrogenase small subunit [Chloroflexota bacterium]|jgi:aerobic-type carbon monoxide dehydrogenase small subunit (CoxS/CutS family)|nr:aerobic carbon-monoxide dehydrogenase small subunit [Chloroflexota bacterium]
MKHEIALTVNGREHRLTVESQRTLLEFIRDDLKLFGARESCGMSLCGACTVLVDGVPVSSCSYLAARANGKTITTVEGLGTPDNLHPVQRAFIERGGFQCSYCTPGMILMTTCLLQENPHPSIEEIKDYLSGNLCRCSTYEDIIQSVLAAAELV